MTIPASGFTSEAHHISRLIWNQNINHRVKTMDLEVISINSSAEANAAHHRIVATVQEAIAIVWYKTPIWLKPYLKHFDDSNEWNFGPEIKGVEFLPYPKPSTSDGRHDNANPNRGGEFSGKHCAIPFRKATIHF